ncbi:hypothetical protein [Eisenbergiella massiliensis]|uniref:hypothetical protein n=1 Tax=Eisenbergiella massiliensis TaxID=1720294 RepID=UPI0018A6B087|nr:hypothetical protein [Eisenbergiella massiliensis]
MDYYIANKLFFVMMYNNQLTNTPAFRPLAGINRLVLNDPGRRLGKGRLFRACGI